MRTLIVPIALFMLPATPMPAQSGERGEQLYQSQCAYCHGRDGEGGRGPMLTRPLLRRAPDDEALTRVIRRGLPDAGMPGTTMSDREAAAVAAYVRQLGRKPTASIPGDPARGRDVYTQNRCDQCHTIAGHGGAFGPDLSAIGLRRNAAHLRTSLLDPSADTPDDYAFVRAVTSAGKTIEGIRINEDTFSIQLRLSSNAVESLWKSSLREVRKDLRTSPMPSYRQLPAQSLDDLIAYLASLREVE
ncbi:MAG: c-type cytochrome [Bryobacterales bacterium]|nr:c-type cytochrome [Bryobacterales bacterium]